MLKEVAFSKHAGSSEIILIAEDTLDEGFNIKLTVTINPEVRKTVYVIYLQVNNFFHI